MITSGEEMEIIYSYPLSVISVFFKNFALLIPIHSQKQMNVFWLASGELLLTLFGPQVPLW